MNQDYARALLFCLPEVQLSRSWSERSARRRRRWWSSPGGSPGGKKSRLEMLHVLGCSGLHPCICSKMWSSRHLAQCLHARCTGWQVGRQTGSHQNYIKTGVFTGHFYFGRSLFFHLESVLLENLQSQNSCLNIVPSLMDYLLCGIPPLSLFKYMGSYFLTLVVMKYLSQKGLWHRALPVSYSTPFLSGRE